MRDSGGEEVSVQATGPEVESAGIADLAILGVDFDPPLDAQTLLSDGANTLMVAIENRGAVVHNDIQVIARLLDPTRGERNGMLLLEDRTMIPSVAPGEVIIARFKHLGRVPARSRYLLQIELEPPEANVYTNNGRIFEIMIVPE